jgi:hypothetical protein
MRWAAVFSPPFPEARPVWLLPLPVCLHVYKRDTCPLPPSSAVPLRHVAPVPQPLRADSIANSFPPIFIWLATERVGWWGNGVYLALQRLFSYASPRTERLWRPAQTKLCILCCKSRHSKYHATRILPTYICLVAHHQSHPLSL